MIDKMRMIKSDKKKEHAPCQQDAIELTLFEKNGEV